MIGWLYYHLCFNFYLKEKKTTFFWKDFFVIFEHNLKWIWHVFRWSTQLKNNILYKNKFNLSKNYFYIFIKHLLLKYSTFYSTIWLPIKMKKKKKMPWFLLLLLIRAKNLSQATWHNCRRFRVVERISHRRVLILDPMHPS